MWADGVWNSEKGIELSMFFLTLTALRMCHASRCLVPELQPLRSAEARHGLAEQSANEAASEASSETSTEH